MDGLLLCILILSYKWPSLCKVHFYAYQANLLTYVLLPHEHKFSIQLHAFYIRQVLFFATCYFHFWPSTILTCLQIAMVYLNRNFYHGDPIQGVAIFVSMMQWVSMACFMHVVMTKMGMFYVEADFIKGGYESVLNNLEEGLIMVNQHSRQIEFVNASAKKMISDPAGNSTLLDHE